MVSYYLLQEYAEHLNQRYIEIAVQQNSEISKRIALSQAEVCITTSYYEMFKVHTLSCMKMIPCKYHGWVSNENWCLGEKTVVYEMLIFHIYIQRHS